MIKRKEDLVTVSKNIQGGIGEVKVTEFLEREEFCGKGRLFSRMVLEPGNSVGAHTHTGDLEVFYIIKGEGKLIDNGEESRLYQGDVALTKDGENHEFINDTNEDLEFIALILFSK
jgi:quercetin dioxygenase-like cupin family protein